MAKFPENEIEILPDCFKDIDSVKSNLEAVINVPAIQNIPSNDTVRNIQSARRRILNFLRHSNLNAFRKIFVGNSEIYEFIKKREFDQAKQKIEQAKLSVIPTHPLIKFVKNDIEIAFIPVDFEFIGVDKKNID